MIRLQILVLYVNVMGLLMTPAVAYAQTTKRTLSTTSADGLASVEGVVVNADSNFAIPQATVQVKSEQGSALSKTTTSAEGKYALRVDPRKSYRMVASAPGYDPTDVPLTFTSSTTDRLYGKIIFLRRSGTKPPMPPATTSVAAAPPAPVAAASAGSAVPVANGGRVTPPKTLDAKVTFTPPLTVAAVGKTTQLPAIQFVQSKAELMPGSILALDQLLAYMRSHPTAEIMLAGHTDNQGDFDENLKLSQQRVDLVKNHLVQNGIAANRITARGYGPTRPIASNNREETRRQNRRVELIVLKE